jgi:hypothetical protein
LLAFASVCSFSFLFVLLFELVSFLVFNSLEMFVKFWAAPNWSWPTTLKVKHHAIKQTGQENVCSFCVAKSHFLKRFANNVFDLRLQWNEILSTILPVDGFDSQIRRAQRAGALAVIVVQTAPAWPYTMTDASNSSTPQVCSGFKCSVHSHVTTGL